MIERLETPLDIRHQIWKELGLATKDRHHAWRTPVLATVGLDGGPNARTVVLRSVDKDTNQLQIYTDSRSSKAIELVASPNALLVFWSPRLSWQLRVHTRISLMTTGPQLEQLWNQVKQSKSAGDYLSPLAPGSPIESEFKTTSTNKFQDINFAVLTAQILDIDWLELASSGHRRAKLTQDTWEWVVP